MFKSESELAKKVQEYFISRGYKGYYEVTDKYKRGRCDMIFCNDIDTIIVEAKLTFNITLLKQVMEWSESGNYKYVAIPSKKKTSDYFFFQELCKNYGIGIILVNNTVSVVLESFYNSNPTKIEMYEEFSENDAGTTKQKFLTPFKVTVKRLIETVENNPDITLKKALEKTNHHYASLSSAVNAIQKLIKSGVIPELMIMDKTKILHLVRP